MDIIKDLAGWTQELGLTEDSRRLLRLLTVPCGLVVGLLPFLWVLLFTGREARRAGDGQWWERGRAVYPMRMAAGGAPGAAILPAFMLIVVGWRHDSVAVLLSGLGMAATSWLTAGLTAQWLDCRLTRRQFSPGKAAAALAPALLLYGSLLTIFGVVTVAGGREWNLKLALTVAGGLAAYHLWTGSVLPRIIWRLTDDPPPWVVEAVQAAIPPGTTPPPVRILRSDSVNALAMLRHGWIAFTRGAVKHLTPEEITCTARHEVAHLSEPVREIRRRQRGLLALVPPLLIAPLIASFGFSMGLVLAFAGSWMIGAVLSGHSQRMEKRADAAGAGEDAAAYARSLERIYELNFMPAVIAMPGQSHPDLYDRMLAAGVQPAYPRPAPPKWMAARVARIMGFITMLLTGVIWMLLLDVSRW